MLVLASAVAAAFGGYRLGFLARVVSWMGMAVGTVAGALVLSPLLRSINTASDAQLLLISMGVLFGSAFLGQALGLWLGSQMHVALPGTSIRSLDRGAGSVAGIAGVLIGLWLMLPLMADVPGWFATQSRSSAIARLVDQRFPPAPDTMTTLRRLVGGDQFPRVFAALQAAPDLGPPPTVTGINQAVVDAVVPSTVKVEGVACRRVQDGTGWVVGPDLVVTNAHVVAGETETIVQRSDGSEVRALVVAFDPRRDVAVLRANGLNRQPLSLVDVAEGDRGAVFGHPGGGPLVASPFQVGRKVTATGTDIYDQARTERKVLILSSNLAPGDSGGSLIDPQGHVVGMAFAIAPDKPGVAYALDPSEIRPVLAGNLSQAVDTGPCLR